MKLWDLSGYSEKSNIQEAYLPKTSIPGQIVSEILAQLCSDDSIQILLNLTWVLTFTPGSNMRLLAVNNKSNKTNSEKRILYFSQSHQASKTAWQSHVLIKEMQGMGKESITLSMELAKTQCYEFECFEDNYSLTISTQRCRINSRKFNSKET